MCYPITLIGKSEFISIKKAALGVAFLLLISVQAMERRVILQSSYNGMSNKAEYVIISDNYDLNVGLNSYNLQYEGWENDSSYVDLPLDLCISFWQLKQKWKHWSLLFKMDWGILNSKSSIASTDLPEEIYPLYIKTKLSYKQYKIQLENKSHTSFRGIEGELKFLSPLANEKEGYSLSDSLLWVRGAVYYHHLWAQKWWSSLELSSLSGYMRIQGLRRDDLGDTKRFAMLRSGFDQWGLQTQIYDNFGKDWIITMAYNCWKLQLHPTEHISNGATFMPKNLLEPSLNSILGQSIYQKTWSWSGKAYLKHLNIGGEKSKAKENMRFKAHFTYHYLNLNGDFLEKIKNKGMIGVSSQQKEQGLGFDLHGAILGLQAKYSVPIFKNQLWILGIEKWQPLSLKTTAMDFLEPTPPPSTQDPGEANLGSEPTAGFQNKIHRWRGGLLLSAGISWGF